MKYRKFGKTDFDASILGMGCMRLPVLGDNNADINEPEAIKMIRYAIDNGVNYVDTAYPYHSGQSELLVAKALKDGYREKVKLATKFPTWLLTAPSDFDKYLNEQLSRLETDHIDFYLLHALDKGRWDNLLKQGVFKAIESYKKSGKVKYIGFSFHDDLSTFKKITDAYDWDFCQIQLNYMDEIGQAGLEGMRYAASKGIPLVIMEPLRGGKLAAKPADSVAKIWDRAKVKRTPAEWALRWVWNFPEVAVVLSGMSTMEQLKENLKIADQADPQSLTREELAIVNDARDTYKSLSKIGCTDCKYCMPCPFGIDIPTNFAHYNDAHIYGDLEGMKEQYRNIEGDGQSYNCKECGVCESKCPQKLPIRTLLKQVTEVMAK